MISELSPPTSRRRALTAVHIAVFLFGLSGLFGKLISLPSCTIVFGRTMVAALFLGIAIVPRSSPSVQLRSYPRFALAGALLAVHWVTFFHSIQVSSVAVGLLTFSTFPA